MPQKVFKNLRGSILLLRSYIVANFFLLVANFMNAHVDEWSKIWESRFDVFGNCDLAARIHVNFYYVLSSMPLGTDDQADGYPFFGISPGSLANDDQNVCKVF